MNILIVDDEYYIVQGIVKIISESFTEFDCIYQAYSTEQAKRIIEKESIDILITDIEMPKETGLSLVFWIYSNAYPIICMILSGHQRFDYAQKALRLHCASYVLKPIDKTQLCDEIRHALELKQNQSHPESAASISSIAPAKLTRLLVLTLHPCALIRQRSFLKEPTGEWILLQKKLDFPAAPTFINNSKK